MTDIFIHQNHHQSIIVTAKVSHYTVWYVRVDYNPAQNLLHVACMLHEIFIHIHELANMHVAILMYMHVSCNMHGFRTLFMHVPCT